MKELAGFVLVTFFRKSLNEPEPFYFVLTLVFYIYLLFFWLYG